MKNREIKFKVVDATNGAVIGIERLNEHGAWEQLRTGRTAWLLGSITAGQDSGTFKRLQYSGVNDRHNTEIFEGDKAITPFYSGTVVFDSGCFSLLIEKALTKEYHVFDVGQTPPLCDFSGEIAVVPEVMDNLSDFNKKLKTALDFNPKAKR